MEVRNCRQCRKIFNYIMGPIICPSCKEKEEELFQEIKAYVKEHKGTTVNILSEEFDVSARQIEQWIREDRLQFTDDSGIKLACEKCGALILSGRFCDNCKRDMTKGLNSMYAQTPVRNQKQNEPQKSGSNRMHFIDN